MAIGFPASLHQAKPVEKQTLMNMFGWLGAEVERLDQERKAQKILDLVWKAIHEAVSETKRECLGQMPGAAVGAAQTQKVENVTYQLDAIGCELRATQAMVGSPSPPGIL